MNLVHLLLTHTLEYVHFLDACLLHRAITMSDGDVHSLLERATMNTTYGDATGVARIVERRNKHLRCAFEHLRCGDNLHNLVEQIVDIVCRSIEVLSHPTILCRTVNNGEVELILCSVEREHKIEHHLIDLLRATVGLVHLVDNDNGLQTNL